MDSSQQQKQDDVMEVPEIHGDLLLELLDASLAAEDASQQLGLAADVDVDCLIESQEPSYDIHTHQDCEDCGLDGILCDFDEYGSSRSKSPAPYAVFDHDDTLEWAETADAAMDPFNGECTGDWYMDGLAMAMEWEESGFPFEPCYEEEVGAEHVYVYGSPLWE